ncbi:MAG: metal-dependent transcriptional regulator [Candidatus Thermoplasmatota archaeon]|uniref:Metal-dependent transcriptional regulator n=1 Tax=Candidatus Sysuiplasma superficiale TaxID=2823368 RepID=A0A8J7YJE4_9ARCH|nr:metal-dependent transcriptional regulator [Candidatus Sysuiplasma superficiale]MCL4346829.1 metal-dependent transcriptional regulator [Candidatus Thermoplasmatota archaeon]
MSEKRNTPEITRKERDCIMRIVEMTNDSFPVRLCDLSRAMDVKPPSAFELVNRLSKKGMVRAKNGMISLTDDGRRTYDRIKFSHRALESLLVKGGISADTACREIETFDYIVERKTALAILKTIGNPSECPHGLPIRSRE